MKDSSASRTRKRASLGVFLLLSCVAPGATGPTEELKPTSEAPAAIPNHEYEPFVVVHQEVYIARVTARGAYRISAFHTADASEAVRKATIYRKQSPDPYVLVTFCRGSPEGHIPLYLGVADEYVMAAFWDTSDQAPKPEDRVWPNYDNKLVNRLREIRRIAAGKRLIASGLSFHERLGVFVAMRGGFKTLDNEEMQWLILAIVGAKWQGIALDPLGVDKPCPKMQALATALQKHGTDIGAAKLVGWVEPPDGQPLSAMASERKLFVFLLNPKYMKVGPGESICRPLDASSKPGEIVMSPPAGCTVQAGAYYDGRALPLTRAGEVVRARYVLNGGGTMLVFDLSWDEAAPATVSPEKGR